MQPVCKSYLKERYPSFCQLKSDSLTKFLISVNKYRFVLKRNSSLKMSRSTLSVVVEIEQMSIVVAERFDLKDLIKKTFRSKFG